MKLKAGKHGVEDRPVVFVGCVLRPKIERIRDPTSQDFDEIFDNPAVQLLAVITDYNTRCLQSR
jgi:hypothetical protein